MKIYYIGGSPYSRKTTAAEMISKKYGLFYYDIDDRLFSARISSLCKNKYQ